MTSTLNEKLYEKKGRWRKATRIASGRENENLEKIQKKLLDISYPIALRYLLPLSESMMAVPFRGFSLDSNTRTSALVYK